MFLKSILFQMSFWNEKGGLEMLCEKRYKQNTKIETTKRKTKMETKTDTNHSWIGSNEILFLCVHND